MDTLFLIYSHKHVRNFDLLKNDNLSSFIWTLSIEFIKSKRAIRIRSLYRPVHDSCLWINKSK